MLPQGTSTPLATTEGSLRDFATFATRRHSAQQARLRTGPSSICSAEKGAVERADHASFVFGRPGFDPARVLGARDSPDRLRLACGGEVLRLPDVLASHSGLGIDQEDGARSYLVDTIDHPRRRGVVREHRGGGSRIGFAARRAPCSDPVSSASPIRKPAPSETTALNALDSRGRFEQDLAADRRAEPADPTGRRRCDAVDTSAPAIRSRSPAQRTMSPSLSPCPRRSRRRTP